MDELLSNINKLKIISNDINKHVEDAKKDHTNGQALLKKIGEMKDKMKIQQNKK